MTRIVLATAVSLLTTTAVTALPAAAGTPSRVALPSPNPPGMPGTTKPLDPTTPLNLRVYLARQPGLTAAVTAVSNPHGPDYAHYLSPAPVSHRHRA